MRSVQFIILLFVAFTAAWAEEPSAHAAAQSGEIADVAMGASDSSRVVLHGAIPETPSIAVVAEGDLEPRSVGSYGLRLYAGSDPRFPYDRFVAGTIKARDGVVEKLTFVDLDGNDSYEIIVVIRSVGTGSYLSADAYNFDGSALMHLASVSGLAKDADPIAALRNRVEEQQSDVENESRI
jgi:hypothetical protein